MRIKRGIVLSTFWTTGAWDFAKGFIHYVGEEGEAEDYEGDLDIFGGE